MIVTIQKPIEFENNCDCIVDISDLEQAICWYSNKPVCKAKKIFMHGRYPAVAIYKEKIHVHRLLMMYWLKRRLNSEEYVHHLDEDKKNALKGNLGLMQASEHQSMHNKGKKLSPIHRQRIAEGNRRRARRYEHPELIESVKAQ